MASRYHWAVTGTNGLTLSTGIPPAQTLVVPANGRSVRLVTHVSLVGAQSNTSDYSTVGPLEVEHYVTLASTQYPQRTVYRRRQPTRVTGNGYYDVITTQRVFTLYHALGDAELGINTKQSYGGPGKGAITYTMNTVFIKAFNTHVTFNVSWDLTMFVLYYL